jgi:hypothetical protein
VCSAVSSVPLLVSSSGTNGGSSSVPTTTPAG